MSADGEPWGAIAHRGKLTIEVLTRARADQDSIEVPETAALVLLVHPDGASIVPLSCASIADALTFIREMVPRSVTVKVAGHEDVAPLTEILRREGSTIH